MLLLAPLVLSAVASAAPALKVPPGSPPPPAPEAVAKWAGFPASVKLRVAKTRREFFVGRGIPVWSFYYASEKQTPYTFGIDLYKAGTLLGKNRSAAQLQIEQRAQAQKNSKTPQFFGFETRPNGRKVYLFPAGFGIGGPTSAVWSTIGKYDVVLLQLIGKMEPDKKGAKVPKGTGPTQSALQIFKSLDGYIAKPH